MLDDMTLYYELLSDEDTDVAQEADQYELPEEGIEDYLDEAFE